MREKLLACFLQVFETGITPACAGKTIKRIQASVFAWDHPRVCGKNQFSQQSLQLLQGSPPHVREKLHIDNGIFTQSRITPACAGKTFISDIMVMRARDHPRMCGKNVRIAALEISCVGSPPRVREKRNFRRK